MEKIFLSRSTMTSTLGKNLENQNSLAKVILVMSINEFLARSSLFVNLRICHYVITLINIIVIQHQCTRNGHSLIHFKLRMVRL